MIKTEYRNDVSKDLTKYAPSFKDKIEKMLKAKFEEGQKNREKKELSKTKSTSVIKRPISEFTS